MDAPAWLDRLLPEVPPDPWAGCWVASVKAHSAEHHPPLYWLGRALDAVADDGGTAALAGRLTRVHGPDACDGVGAHDQAAQDVLSEACAYAWAAAHLGPPRFEPAREGLGVPEGLPPPPAGVLLVHVPSHDAWLAPQRLWPVRTMDQLLQQVAARSAAAARALPEASGRILYVDVFLNLRFYAQEVGYRSELTEPLRAAVKHFAAEDHLGHVLTRPFEWGRALEAEY